MSSQQQWARLLSAAGRPTGGVDRESLLDEAMTLGLRVAPSTVGCSVTLLVGAAFSTPTASGAVARELDRVQYDAGTGPCMVAARDRQGQRLDAMADSRFIAFTHAAARHGVRSSWSLPLIGTYRPAALNLYASTAGAFVPERPRAVAGLLSRCLARLMGAPSPSTTAEAREPTADLAAARSQRAVIVQAEEALMARDHLSRHEAFAALALRSQREGRSILPVARDMLSATGLEAAR